MTAIKDFEKLVQMDMPSAPQPIVEFAVKRAIIEFCEGTWILSKDINMTLTTGDIDTTLHNSVDVVIADHVDGLRMAAVVTLMIDGTKWEVEYVDFAEDAEIPDFESVFNIERKQITFLDQDTLRIYNLSASDSNIYLKLAFKPAMDMTEVDDRLYEDWVEPIVAGAKARLLSSPGKDWTDRDSATLNYRFFRKGIADAMTKVQKNFADQPHRVEWQVFGGVQ